MNLQKKYYLNIKNIKNERKVSINLIKIEPPGALVNQAMQPILYEKFYEQNFSVKETLRLKNITIVFKGYLFDNWIYFFIRYVL